jgi:hypothetical protein
VVLSVTGSLYNCYVYFLVSVLREALDNCYIVFCKMLSFSEYEDWMHNMVFFLLILPILKNRKFIPIIDESLDSPDLSPHELRLNSI